jgi:hypothetical protein
VKGDGCLSSASFNSGSSSSPVDFFRKMKSLLVTSPFSLLESNEEQQPNKRGKLRAGPLPVILPLLSLKSPSASASASDLLPFRSLSSSASSSSASSVTEEQFLKGIQPLLQMSKETFFETRLEASKMLCDLSTKERNFLELPTCINLCCSSLELLLKDEFEDVKQFAVLALTAFAEFSSFYRSHILSSFGKSSLQEIVSLIRNVEVGSSTYATAQMRRKASYLLSLLIKEFPKQISEELKEYGYDNKDSWLFHVDSLTDHRMRNYGKEIAAIYAI